MIENGLLDSPWGNLSDPYLLDPYLSDDPLSSLSGEPLAKAQSWICLIAKGGFRARGAVGKDLWATDLGMVCGCRPRGSAVWHYCWKVVIDDAALGAYWVSHGPYGGVQAHLKTHQRHLEPHPSLGLVDGRAGHLGLVHSNVLDALPMGEGMKPSGLKIPVDSSQVCVQKMRDIPRCNFGGGGDDRWADRAPHDYDALTPPDVDGRSNHLRRVEDPCH